MMKKHLVEFADGSARATATQNDGISMSFSGEEVLQCVETAGLPFISGNRAGLVKLGEILIQIGLSDYRSGFHIHINEDFDEGKGEILILGLGDST